MRRLLLAAAAAVLAAACSSAPTTPPPRAELAPRPRGPSSPVPEPPPSQTPGPNTVGSTAVIDGSLTAADLAADSVAASELAAGAVAATTDLAGSLCGTGEQLVDIGASWVCLSVGDQFDLCRSGMVKGGGYDAVTDTYAWTCGNYPWSAEKGGRDANNVGAFDTPTTVGGNAYDVTCTGFAVPDTACRYSGQTLRVNFMADAMLAQDMTAPNGEVYFPANTYVHRGCGEQANGTNNACPVLRAPNDTYQNFGVSFGVRGITWVGEGMDADGLVIGGVSGTAFLNDTGDAFDGLDPSEVLSSVVLSNRPLLLGLDADVNRCFPHASGGCIADPALAAQRWRPDMSSTIAVYLLPYADATSNNTTLCFDNRETAGVFGVCSGDHRISCDDDTDCSAYSMGSCIGAVDAAAARFAAGKSTLICYGKSPNRIESAYNQIPVAEIATIRSVPGAACGSGNLGKTVELEGWPWSSADFELAKIYEQKCFMVDEDQAALGGIRGVTFAPANNSTYGVLAASAPDADAVSDGTIVTIVDGTTAANSCDDVDGVLTGGGTYRQTCKAVAGDWNPAACHTTDVLLPGCPDTESPLSIGAGIGGLIEYSGTWHASNRDQPDTDATVGNAMDGFPHQQDVVVRDFVFGLNEGHLTDIGPVHFERVRFFRNHAIGSNESMHKPAFGTRAMMDKTIFEQNTGYGRLVGLNNAGRGLVIRNTISNGNEASSLIEARYLYDVLIDGWWSDGDHARFAIVAPGKYTDDYSGVEAFTIANVYAENLKMAASDGNVWGSGAGRASGTELGKAAIMFTDYRSASFQGRIRDVRLENIHIRPAAEACGVAFEEPDVPASSVIDDIRMEVSIRGLYVDGSVAGASTKPLCRFSRASFAVADVDSDLGVFADRYRARWEDVSGNTGAFADHPYKQMAATSRTDLTCGVDVPVGTVIAIHDDATASGTCADAGADDDLDGGGTYPSLCKCSATAVGGGACPTAAPCWIPF